MKLRHLVAAFVLLCLHCACSFSQTLAVGAESAGRGVRRLVFNHHPMRVLASRSGRRRAHLTPMMQHTVAWIRNYNPKISQPAAEHYVTTIWNVSKEQHVDPLLVVSLVAQESAFQANARSPVGAQGLGQLMKGTAAELGVRNAFDPDDNLQGCIKLVAENLGVFQGKVKLALAAYNAGPGAVQHYKGIPPYEETRNYVHNIIGNYYGLQRELYTEN